MIRCLISSWPCSSPLSEQVAYLPLPRTQTQINLPKLSTESENSYDGLRNVYKMQLDVFMIGLWV